MLVFEDGDHIRVRAGRRLARALYADDRRPFKEPISPYGPFVMNTQDEIQQALTDLRNGTFVQN